MHEGLVVHAVLAMKGNGLRIVGTESVPGVDNGVPVAEEAEDTLSLALITCMLEIALRELAILLHKRLVHIELLHAVLPGRIESLLAHHPVALHRVADGKGGIREDAVVAVEHLGIHAAHRGAEDERGLFPFTCVKQELESLLGMYRQIGSHHAGLGEHLTQAHHRAAAAAGAETVDVEHRLATHEFGKLLDIGIVHRLSSTS